PPERRTPPRSDRATRRVPVLAARGAGTGWSPPLEGDLLRRRERQRQIHDPRGHRGRLWVQPRGRHDELPLRDAPLGVASPRMHPPRSYPEAPTNRLLPPSRELLQPRNRDRKARRRARTRPTDHPLVRRPLPPLVRRPLPP